MALKQTAKCIGDCNIGIPCQSCGSNGQYIGKIKYVIEVDYADTPDKGVWITQYMNNWTTDSEESYVCGVCRDYGSNGCTTSQLEAKYGSGSTPACTEFKSALHNKKDK